MKKFLMAFLGSASLFGGFFAIASAHSTADCKEVEFDHETVCVSISQVRSDRFRLDTERTDGTQGTLRCDIMLPDSGLKSIPACNGEFGFDDSESGRIKLRIRSNEEAPTDWEDKPSSSSSIRTYPTWMYDFDNEEWLDSDNEDNNGSNTHYNTDNFSITASPASPDVDEYVDVTVKARDNTSTDDTYRGTVKFKVEKRSSSSSSWTTATSSYYTLARTSYTFTSSDDGEHDFSNLVRFRNDSYDYRLVVYDEDDDDIVGYKTFDLNGGSSNSDYNTDNFYVTASPASPDEDEYVDITLKARDGTSTDESYRGTVRFKVERKSGSSWITATSTYYTLARTSYTFTSSDDGEHDFSNLVRFRNDAYDYRLVVTDDDDDDIVGYKTFYLNGGSDSDYDTDNFYLTASPTDPDEDEYVDITVKARDGTSTDESYRGTVRFKVERKSGSSWITATSTYYTLARTSYTFTSSDDGEHDFSNLVRFRNDAYEYRLVVYDDDDDDIVGYKVFDLNGGSSSNGDLDNFALSADDTTPTVNTRVDLTIEARDSDDDTVTDYTDTVNFKVYKRASGSSSWTLTTSSTDFEMDSDYDDGYDFTSSDDGEATLSNFIRFKRNNYSYKVRVYDENDTTIYKELTFTVGSSSSSNGDLDNFSVTADDTTPDTDQYVDVTIEARDSDDDIVTDYDGRVNFTVQRYSNSSRVSASTSYYTLARTYYIFTSSDDGEKILTNLIKFELDGRYRLVVTDNSDTSIKNYREFDVNYYGGGSSDIDGFTSSELDTVQEMYDARPDMIDNLKADYPSLRNSTTWNNRSDDFYDDMGDILDDVSDRTYDTYDDWYDGWISWYRYTINLR